MLRPPVASGWLDDVAEAATAGPWRLIVAVVRDLPQVEELREWLESAVPAIGPWSTETASADDLIARLASVGSSDEGRVWVCTDAARGDETAVAARWAGWNRDRDRMVEALTRAGRRDALVLPSTATRMPEATRAAPDLFAIATVITCASEPISIGVEDPDERGVYEQARQELEARYGLSTEQVVRKLLAREPCDEVPRHDLERWKSIIEALRETGP